MDKIIRLTEREFEAAKKWLESGCEIEFQAEEFDGSFTGEVPARCILDKFEKAVDDNTKKPFGIMGSLEETLNELRSLTMEMVTDNLFRNGDVMSAIEAHKMAQISDLWTSMLGGPQKVYIYTPFSQMETLFFNDLMVDTSYLNDGRLILWNQDETRCFYFDISVNYYNVTHTHEYMGEERTSYPFKNVRIRLSPEDLKVIREQHLENMAEDEDLYDDEDDE